MGFYNETDDIEVLRERIGELSRIRQDYTTQLGSSLYEAVKSDDELRWGREALFEGIAACDNERAALLVRISELKGEQAGALQPADPEVPEAAEEEVAIESAQERDEVAFVKDAGDEEARAEDSREEAAPLTSDAPDDLDGKGGIVQAMEIHDAPEPGQPVPPTDATVVLGADSTVVAPLIHAQPEQEEVAAQLEADNLAPLCLTCGAPVGIHDKFCMTCGTPIQVIEESVPAPAASVDMCPNCGNPVDASFKFCMTCGYKLR